MKDNTKTMTIKGKTKTMTTNDKAKMQSFRQRLFSWRTLTILILHTSYCILNTPVVTMTMALVCMCGPLHSPANKTTDMTSNISTDMTSNVINDQIFVATSADSTNMTDQMMLIKFSLNNGTSHSRGYEFSWDSETRGLLISSYMFGGFLVPQMANTVRACLGNKWTLTIYATIAALLNFVAPVAARGNVYFLLAIRILLGLTVNAQIPVASDTLAWWIPAEEKLTAATIVTMGWLSIGVFLPPLAGLFCKITTDNGWPFIFYFNGVIILVWILVWHGLSSQRPEEHPFISQNEKTYIIAHRVGMENVNTKTVSQTPYRAILTSRPFVIFVLSFIFTLWPVMAVLNCLPLYLTSVLGFSITDAGLVFAVMSALRLPAALFWSALGNWLMGRIHLHTNYARKICFCVGQGIAAVLFLGASFFDHQDKWLATSLVVASILMSTFGSSLSSVIPLDMAPRHAGFMSALTVSVGILVSTTAPIFVTSVASNGLFQEWRIIWLTMAGAHVVAGLLFLVFADASLQPWATPDGQDPPLIVSMAPPLTNSHIQEETIALTSPETDSSK